MHLYVFKFFQNSSWLLIIFPKIYEKKYILNWKKCRYYNIYLNYINNYMIHTIYENLKNITHR